jgi:uncharacterized protein YndB with AHSA1/START domain
MQDTIERSIDIAAPLERVWELVTEPGWWVPTDAPVEAVRTPGHIAVRESEKHGRLEVEVVELRPMTYAAFRWSSTVPGGNITPGQSTLVEFTVAPADDSVRVSVVESGFVSLDATDDIKNGAIESHTGGWADELGSLRTRAEA